MNKFTEYANSFQAVANLELENIKRLTEKLKNPQKKLKFIHVAGTNGQGSVCAILQTALTHAGYKTGKYISPNLVDVCERVSVDGTEITHAELEEIMKIVKEAADGVYNDTGSYPTQFELWTAAAFLYFETKKVDVVVLETGLGGQHDATNIVDNTICSVITKISIDHISYLGGSIDEIAKAKAGIIKDIDGIGITVSAVQEDAAMTVIQRKAKEKNNKLYIVNTPESKAVSGICEVFDLGDMKNVVCSLGGLHQIENAAIAAEVLKKLDIDDKSIRYGIENAKNPARFEMVSENPTVIFDGGHNPDGIRSLANSIRRYFPEKKKNFVMGVMADKDLHEMLSVLKEHGVCENSKFFTVTVKDNPRAMKAEELSVILNRSDFSAVPCESISKAITSALEGADVVFIFGSLYLYKDFSEEKSVLA